MEIFLFYQSGMPQDAVVIGCTVRATVADNPPQTMPQWERFSTDTQRAGGRN